MLECTFYKWNYSRSKMHIDRVNEDDTNIDDLSYDVLHLVYNTIDFECIIL